MRGTSRKEALRWHFRLDSNNIKISGQFSGLGSLWGCSFARGSDGSGRPAARPLRAWAPGRTLRPPWVSGGCCRNRAGQDAPSTWTRGGQRPALASATLSLRPQEAPSGPESAFPCQETGRWGWGLLSSSTVCQGISNEGILCVWKGKASPCNSSYADHAVWNRVNGRVSFQV